MRYREKRLEGSKHPVVGPGFRIPNVSCLGCHVGKGKQTATAPMRRPRKVPFIFLRFFTWGGLHFDVTVSTNSRTNFSTTLVSSAAHTPHQRGPANLTAPQVTWSVGFSKRVWREPAGWENAKSCISLKRDAIFELLIEKNLNCK